MRIKTITILVALAWPCLAAAQDATPVSPTTAPATSTAPSKVKPAATAANDPNKRICRSMVDSGSIMPKHVCRTRSEWTMLANAGQAGAQGFFDHRGSGGSDHTGP